MRTHPDGSTEREHLEAAARQGSRPAQMRLRDGPECPLAAAYLWGWFAELHSRRTGNGYGPNPITFEAIEAWSRLTETKLTPWEADTITALDAVYLTAIAKQRREEDSKDRAAGRR